MQHINHVYCSSNYYFFCMRRHNVHLYASCCEADAPRRYLYVVVRVWEMNPREPVARDGTPTKESETGHFSSPLSANASSANCSRFSWSRSDRPCTDRRNCDRGAHRAIKRIRERERLGFPWTDFPGMTGGFFFLSAPEAPYRAGIIPAPGSSFLIYDPGYEAGTYRGFYNSDHIYVWSFHIYARYLACETISIRGISTRRFRAAHCRFNGRTEVTREIQRKLSRANCTAIRL